MTNVPIIVEIIDSINPAIAMPLPAPPFLMPTAPNINPMNPHRAGIKGMQQAKIIETMPRTNEAIPNPNPLCGGGF